MDTKSKNVKEENVVTDNEIRKGKFDSNNSYEEMVSDFRRIKLLRTLAMIFLAMAIALSIISGNDFKVNRHLFKDESKYGWSFLGDDINEFTKEVLKFGHLYKTEEYVKDSKNISTDEMDIARAWAKDQVESEYRVRVDELYSRDTSQWDENRWNKEQENIRKQITEEYGYDDEALKQMIVEQKTIIFTKKKNLLNSNKNLKFIIYDRVNDIWMSNYEGNEEGIQTLKRDSGYFAEHHIGDNSNQSSIYINEKKMTPKDLEKIGVPGYNESHYRELNIDYYFEGEYYGSHAGESPDGQLDIYISVLKQRNLVPGDEVYSDLEEFEKAQNSITIQMWSFLGAVIVSIILLLILKKSKYKGSYFDFLINKLKVYPIEFIVIGLVTLFIIKSMRYWGYWSNYYRSSFHVINMTMWTVVLLGSYVVFKIVVLKYQEGEILKGSYLIKFYEYVQICLEKGSFGRKLFLILAIYVLGLIGGTFLLIVGLEEVGFILAIGGAVAATVLFVFTATRDLAYLNKITIAAKNICEGRSSENIPEKRKGALRDLAHSINNMKEGLRTSIENETKSERMKTELITNVSHDLKTPLTSIINYVDLLKRCEVQPEEAKTYVEVLDKKSQRLKILIDDLFEASKAASGSMQLTFSRVEVVALLRQTLGEAEGRIEKANLDFKISVPENKVYINADGRKLWRVFENLISNIIKYSLPGTRVYINVTEYDGEVYITMKNISSYELNFDPEEIMERFKRGEESRHTEGSGLGLAIAKNIVNLHGGEMKIDIDGDLFKSTVIFDVYHGEV